MTQPTKALCPILLEDYRKLTVDRRGESNFFTGPMIQECMLKVTALEVQQAWWLADDFEVRPYYAGHVLGAAMFYVRVGAQSVVYTGDYNMTPDRHLGAAWIDKCRPDLLITESTYATTVRESKRGRERDFLAKVHQAVAQGGKVLIPVFALGRVQELCILIESYWERMGLGVPVYFSAGMAETATTYYKQYLAWTNESIRKISEAGWNPFDFKYIRPFEKHLADIPGPMVLFSTPGMLHSGTSLEVFKKWCGDPRNMVIIPGYCVAGTVGAKVLAGAKSIQFDPRTSLPVNLQVRNLSFSAHADAKGILQLIKNCEPRAVMLVHGEAGKMAQLRELIKRQFKVPCYMPANGEMITIATKPLVPIQVDNRVIMERLQEIARFAQSISADPDLSHDEKRAKLLLIAKERSGPIKTHAVLRWSQEEREAGDPARIIPRHQAEDLNSMIDEISIDFPAPVSFNLIWRALKDHMDTLCIPIVRAEPGKLVIRDDLTVYQQSETSVVILRPCSMVILGNTVFKIITNLRIDS